MAVISFAFFQRDSGPSCAYTAEKGALPDFSGVIEKVMPSLVKVENEGLAGHPDFIGMEGNSNRGGAGEWVAAVAAVKWAAAARWATARAR